MTLEKIKKAIKEGKTVCWCNNRYEVIQDNLGQYLIHCKSNDYYWDLTHNDGVTMNQKSNQFFIN